MMSDEAAHQAGSRGFDILDSRSKQAPGQCSMQSASMRVIVAVSDTSSPRGGGASAVIPVFVTQHFACEIMEHYSSVASM